MFVGAKTCGSGSVRYEIEQSIARANELLGIDISKLKSCNEPDTERCGEARIAARRICD